MRTSDAALIQEVTRLAHDERHATARLIAALAELDARRLYLAEGSSSLFAYCTRVLRLSEHAAYGRIEAARAARRFPVAMLADGDLTLTAVTLLAPHLTPDNHLDVLGRAKHRTKREVEEIVAALRPLPDVRSFVRKQAAPKVSVPAPAGPLEAAPVIPASCAPIPPASNRVDHDLHATDESACVSLPGAARRRPRTGPDTSIHPLCADAA